MTTREAIQLIAQQLTDELVVCTTGYTCRDMQAAADRPQNFYMIGSMGLAAAIGLGVALHRPQKRVVVLDGDGSVLMGLGALPMAAALHPANFIHVVLDNEVFASTGNQPTYSVHVSLDLLARTCGYPAVFRANSAQELDQHWRKASREKGPVFLLVKCQPNGETPKERVRFLPEEIGSRFMEAALA